ncbi:MAG: hypothetical protein HY000_31155 [Planctomycetes bacterium]|nr:hypothetical protein [Planctomycetota bacterium]
MQSLAFNPNDSLLASAHQGVIRMFSSPDGKLLRALRGHTDQIGSLAFSPDGVVLASGSMDGTIRLWDPTRTKGLNAFPGHAGGVTTVAFSPDGQRCEAYWGLKNWGFAIWGGMKKSQIPDRH